MLRIHEECLCVSPGHSICVCLQAIPLPRLKAILPLVFGRTEDKSSNVRKNAVQLLTTVLAANPFAAKVSFSPYVSSVLYSNDRNKGGCGDGTACD